MLVKTYRLSKRTLVAALAFGVMMAGQANANDNLAPGFTTLHKGAKIAVMPADIELYSLTAGGMTEPKAEWTQTATKLFHEAIKEKKKDLGVAVVDVSPADVDELAEVNALHGAVAEAIAMHGRQGMLALPTKDGKLSWSMGDAVTSLKAKTGADYALFSFVRDSYASADRKVAMILLAAAGIGISGGAQVGYATLVDLNSGEVVWFNQMLNLTGDMRDAAGSRATLESLLKKFPASAGQAAAANQNSAVGTAAQ